MAAASQEAWPEAGRRCSDISRKTPRWNADRRARPQRRVGASRSLRGAPRTRWCGQFHLRLSAFRFLRFLSSLRAKRSNPVQRCSNSGLLRRFAPRNDGESTLASSPVQTGRGPRSCAVEGASDASLTVVERVSSSPTPLPPCFAWSPFPASAGQDALRRCLKTESEIRRGQALAGPMVLWPLDGAACGVAKVRYNRMLG